MSRRATVIVSVLAVAFLGALWLGTDLVRDRRGTANPAVEPSEPAGGNLFGAVGDEARRETDGPAAGAAPMAATQPAAATTAEAALDTTLVLAGGEVLVSYPADFGLAVTQEQLSGSSQIPPCDEGFDYCVYLDSGEFDGTNFSSAGLRIDQRDDLANEAACVLAQPEGYTDLVPVVAGASDFATTMYREVNQGAAGHFSQGSVGRLYYDSVCYEFETRVAQAQYGNFPTGTIEEFDAADVEATEERLEGLLARVMLPDGRSALWARKVAAGESAADPVADPAAGPVADASSAEDEVDGPAGGTEPVASVIDLSEPLAGATVTSPLRVVGTAPGGWYFEATFPYRLVAADGTVIVSGAIMAGGDWMTEAPVPFESSIEFEVARATDAVLVLMKDNPSGLPEHDAHVEVPLHLSP